MRYLLTLLVSLGSLVPVSGATPTAPIANPVVELYVQRLALENIAVEHAESDVAYLDDVLRALKESGGAVSGRTVLDTEHKASLARIEVRVRQAKAKEAAALLEIAKNRIRSGVDMPLCAEKQ